MQGDITRAQDLYEQAIAQLKESRDYPFLAIALRRVGQMALSRGDLATAAAFIRESLAENWSVRDYRGVAACLASFGALNIAQRQIKRAIQLYAAATSILDFIRTPLLPFDRQQYDRNLAALREKHGPATFDAAWAAGYAKSMERAISYALNSEDDRPKF